MRPGDEPHNGCLFCGGDASEPDHWDHCDGRQGGLEPEAEAGDRRITTTTITAPRETSVRAFYNAVDTGVIRTRREQVWIALQDLGVATASEVFEHLKVQRHFAIRYDSNTSARMTELRDLGVIREIGTRPCRITKQICITWTIVPSSEHAGVAVIRRCPVCAQIVARDVPKWG
jgi:hypothetical protein